MLNLLNWWYIDGWKDFLYRTGSRLANLADFFSIGLLIKTFFAPFRQISAATASHAPLDVKFRMWLDRLVSRVVGAFVRFFIIIAGLICLLLAAIFSLIFIILWPLAPFAPLAGLIMSIMGVTL